MNRSYIKRLINEDINQSSCRQHTKLYKMEKFLTLFVSVAFLITIANCTPLRTDLGRVPKPLTEEEIYQNENAKYQFASNVEDHINDLTQQRVEEREGSNVKGMYSYSDGYYKRTVNYVADKGGYRVIREELVPLSGPKVDPNGSASIDTAAHGLRLRYTVKAEPSYPKTTKLVHGLH